jgi:aminodeoxyfutalosine synthase
LNFEFCIVNDTSMSTSLYDAHLQRLAAGERLSPDEIRELARTPDILPLGMLADALRRRLHGTRVTFLRVATCAFDHSIADAVPPAARELRLTGSPETLNAAVSAVQAARSVAGVRTVSGFAWADAEKWRHDEGQGVLKRLREAGLDAIAELALDRIADPRTALKALTARGFAQVRLSVASAAPAERTELLLRAAELQDEFGCVQALDPLPSKLAAYRPTTGYDDVKMVAIARLAAPNIPTIQVDWPRYGPKLAQVALTFGADDIYGVSASDEAPEGRRRAPLEEIRRNIEAAGFQPVERDGRFS